MSPDEEKLRIIRNQQRIPVVIRRGGKGQSPRVRLPFADNSRAWLGDGRPARRKGWGGWRSSAVFKADRSRFLQALDEALVRLGQASN